MALFGLFGNKKNEASAEEEREAALKAEEEKKAEEVKKAYEGMEWPTIPRFNNIIIADSKEQAEALARAEAQKDQSADAEVGDATDAVQPTNVSEDGNAIADEKFGDSAEVEESGGNDTTGGQSGDSAASGNESGEDSATGDQSGNSAAQGKTPAVTVLDETVSPERKDEIGKLVFASELQTSDLTGMTSQELLFLLTAMETFHRKSPLPGFETNSKKVYYEILGRIRDAKTLYMLYDRSTGYPFIENGYAMVYFEKELCEKMANVYAGQFRRLAALERKVVDDENPTPGKIGFFEYLYYMGIENLVIDNGGYRARFKRNEIVAAPGEWSDDGKDKTPSNPVLNFALTDFVQEAKWPVNYAAKINIMKAKEMRMLNLIRNSSFIVPMQHEGPAQVMADGRIRIDKDTKTKFLIMKTQDDKQFLPVCTDGFEFARINKDREWNAAVFKYKDLLRLVNDKDGIRINPAGQSVALTKQQMMAVEVAGQQADLLKGKKAQVQRTGKSADDAVQQALNQAVAKMHQENQEKK